VTRSRRFHTSKLCSRHDLDDSERRRIFPSDEMTAQHGAAKKRDIVFRPASETFQHMVL
jgi:hypothetical protein